MIVLASASPRRQQLLDMLGIEYEVDPAEIDERPELGELPEALAVRLARAKAVKVAQRHSGVPVLAADTLVVIDGIILGKPSSDVEAARMLGMLSGRQHRVVTAVALARGGETRELCDVTKVWFRSFDEEFIKEYVATGEPLDKAGSYAVQGRGAVLVRRIEGDFFGVMGLPIRLVISLLDAAGLPYRFTR
ncbi:MAG: septum formation inhibitor Maf [Gemmatimonadota bacterium]|nr:MAG: septum formation inhibitor Maf [Gemmatimonadota bacterium]